MPFEKGNTKSVGNKGGGRKSTREEFAKNQAIKKAWEKINNSVETKDVEKIALPLVLKDMVAKIGNPDGSKIEVLPLLGGMSNNNKEDEKRETE